MTDDELSNLFAEGTAPERDAAFVRRVDAQIARAPKRSPLLLHTLRAVLVVAIAGAMFMTLRALSPFFETTPGHVDLPLPHVMGVPLPLVAGALAVGLALRFRGRVRLRLR